jgi:hypothetical protein
MRGYHRSSRICGVTAFEFGRMLLDRGGRRAVPMFSTLRTQIYLHILVVSGIFFFFDVVWFNYRPIDAVSISSILPRFLLSPECVSHSCALDGPREISGDVRSRF